MQIKNTARSPTHPENGRMKPTQSLRTTASISRVGNGGLPPRAAGGWSGNLCENQTDSATRDSFCPAAVNACKNARVGVRSRPRWTMQTPIKQNG